MRTAKGIWAIKLPTGTYMRGDLVSGFPYRTFRTKKAAEEWLKTWPKDGAYPVKIVVKIWESL